MSPKIYLIYGKYTILGIAAWSLSLNDMQAIYE